MAPAPFTRAALAEVRSFWEENPVAAAAIPKPLGSPAYFEAYDRLREINESVPFSSELHEYAAFRDRDVLDVGCGNGYVLSRYAAAGARAHGIDLTAVAVALTRERLALAQLSGTVLQGSAEALPFSDATFDCVCSMGVLHHTPDTKKALAEIHRVLRPGGLVILMLYHRNSVLYRFRFPIMRLWTGKTLAQLVNEVDGAGNPRGAVYSRADARRLLTPYADVRLRVGLLQGWMFPPRMGSFVPERILRALQGRWGWFLYAKARKV